jgi:hypothetical protein
MLLAPHRDRIKDAAEEFRFPFQTREARIAYTPTCLSPNMAK